MRDGPSIADAAAGYAARGWHIFPAPVGTKKSHIAAARTGGPRWGATRDPDTVARYWQTWPDANVAITTGTDSGLWVLDIDTDAGHGVDGAASLAALEAAHGPLPPTLTAVSPSGGRHLYWTLPTAPVRNSAGRLGPGLDVRGDGGMVIAPPSLHKSGEAYRWAPGPTDPVPAPQWLVDLVTREPAQQSRPQRVTPTSLAEAAELLSHIDPDDGGYDQWLHVIMAIHETSGGSNDGLALADTWSARSATYDPDEILQKWAGFTAGRPGGATIATIAEYAKRAGADVAGIGQRHRLMAGFTGAPLGVAMPGMTGTGAAQPSALDMILQSIRDDPTTAVARLAAEVARLSPDERDAALAACGAFGIKQEMRAAVKRALTDHASAAGNERYATHAAPVLQNYFIVQNDNGQPVAVDARGDMPPQSRAALRDALADLPSVLVEAGDGVRPMTAVDHWWTNPETPRYAALGYDPLAGESYTDRHGRPIRNVYRTGHAAPAMPGQIEPFLHIIRVNFPDPSDQSLLLQALAHMCQRPGVLLRWAVVMQGTQGCGKSSIAQAVEYCHGPSNVSHPSPDVIARDFNDYMHRRTLVVVNEIGDHTKRELSSLAEKLKPWITDSPVHIEPKGRPGFQSPNFCNWIFTTNHLHCMLAAPGERRYMHLVSALQTEKQAAEAFPADWWQDPGDADWWACYHAWWRDGGAEYVRAHLCTMPLQAVPSRAPETTTSVEARRAGDGALESMIREAIAEGLPGFRGGWISANAVRDLTDAEDMRPPHGPFLARVLASIGYAHSARSWTTPAESMRFPKAPNRTRVYHVEAREGLDPGQLMKLYDAAQQRDETPGQRPGVVVQMPR